jgi:hypothetical protein
MMHDCEKSHSAIVAAKPTNKAGVPAAEPVEPRARTERDVGEERASVPVVLGIRSASILPIRQAYRQCSLSCRNLTSKKYRADRPSSEARSSRSIFKNRKG